VGAREEILSAVRGAPVPPCDHPGVAGLGIHVEDLAAAFAEVVSRVGGTCVRVPDLPAADQALRALPVHRDARRIVTLVPGVGQGTEDPAGLADPHGLAGLDLCVLPAEIGVAENGAVWIDGRRLPHQALFVIAEHVAIVLDAQALVPDMHQAYGRIEVGGGFGVFLSGPSKTADIEQALVIGAHGARSCTVLVVGPGAQP
jgi:L-lactate dehydrogenase complex protein LldG